MGACFQSTTVDGNLKRAELVEEFQRLQYQDRYENGHEYSGGFGMASGLRVESREPFASVRTAEDWLQDNAEKWEHAIAVTAKDGDALKWVIGAWCAS
jgi:hypothetical protein